MKAWFGLECLFSPTIGRSWRGLFAMKAWFGSECRFSPTIRRSW